MNERDDIADNDVFATRAKDALTRAWMVSMVRPDPA